MPDDSWAANRAGFIRNVLECLLSAQDVGNVGEKKKGEEKILLVIQLKCITGSGFCCCFSV